MADVPAGAVVTEPPPIDPGLGPKAERLTPRQWFRRRLWRHSLLLAFAVFSLFPLVWVASAAINPVDNLATAKLIPDGATLENFRELFDNPLAPFGRWIWNSWYVSLVATILNVFLASLAAYAFSRLRFKGRRIGLLTLLLVQVFPQFLAFVAIFLLLLQIGDVFPALGLDTHPGLILVYLGGAIGFNTFLIKGFMDSVPTSLDESAEVDGASPFQIYWKIILPLARPVLAVIFIITFIGIYSEFLLAQTILRSAEQLTLPVGLRLFVQSDYAAKWGNLAAASLIGALPIVLTFLAAQKQIISGLTQGAVKG